MRHCLYLIDRLFGVGMANIKKTSDRNIEDDINTQREHCLKIIAAKLADSKLESSNNIFSKLSSFFSSETSPNRIEDYRRIIENSKLKPATKIRALIHIDMGIVIQGDAESNKLYQAIRDELKKLHDFDEIRRRLREEYGHKIELKSHE